MWFGASRGLACHRSLAAAPRRLPGEHRPVRDDRRLPRPSRAPPSRRRRGRRNDAGAGHAPRAAPPSNAVRFVAMGDTGTGDAGQKKIAEHDRRDLQEGGCDFVQLLGDNLYRPARRRWTTRSGQETLRDSLRRDRSRLLRRARQPRLRRQRRRHRLRARARTRSTTPRSRRSGRCPSAYFHLRRRSNVELFALDTNMALFSQARRAEDRREHAGSPRRSPTGRSPSATTRTSRTARTATPATTTAPVPPVVNGSGREDRSSRTSICGKVDLYLSGHDHSQQWLNESCKGTELAVSGAGAKTTELAGNEPRPLPVNRARLPLHRHRRQEAHRRVRRRERQDRVHAHDHEAVEAAVLGRLRFTSPGMFGCCRSIFFSGAFLRHERLLHQVGEEAGGVAENFARFWMNSTELYGRRRGSASSSRRTRSRSCR